MSSAAASTANPPATAGSSAAAANPTSKIIDSVATKVQKHVDSLNSKIDKLVAENAALKAQLHQAKASNSRIRRIPKRKGDVQPGGEE